MVESLKNDYTDAKLSREKISEEIWDVQTVTPSHRISKKLIAHYQNVPEALLLWGAKLMKNKFEDIGAQFIQLACKNAMHDKKPGIIFTNAMKTLRQHDFFKLSHDILLDAVKALPGDLHFKGQLGRHYFHEGKLQEAIDILKDIDVDNFSRETLIFSYMHNGQLDKAIEVVKGSNDPDLIKKVSKICIYSDRPKQAIELLENIQCDTVMVRALAKAYVIDGQPDKAINLLRDIQEPNVFSMGILGSAYVDKRDRSSFEKIKEKMRPNQGDYLDAKLYYLEGNNSKVLSILQSYMANEKPAANMLGLYIVALPKDSPVHGAIKSILGHERYRYLLERKEEWLRNPSLLKEGRGLNISSNGSFYETGRVPVNRLAKQSIGGGSPVAATPSLWRRNFSN